MAGKRTKSETTPAPAASAGRQENATTQSSIRIGGIVLRALRYEEFQPPTPTSLDDLRAAGVLTNQTIEITGSARVLKPNDAIEIALNLVMAPAQEPKVYRLALTMAALFVKDANQTPRQAMMVLNNAAGPLMFPFMREIAMNVMSRTLFAPVTVQLHRLGPLLDAESIAAFPD